MKNYHNCVYRVEDTTNHAIRVKNKAQEPED